LPAIGRCARAHPSTRRPFPVARVDEIALRCYDLGRAVRDIILNYPEDLSVGIVRSGGLWHTPGSANSYIDEDFDRAYWAQ
jgi:hypothetical protein